MKITKFGTLSEVAGQLIIKGFGFQFNGESGNDPAVIADALCAYIREKMTPHKAPALMNSTVIIDSVFGWPSPEWIAENLYFPTRQPYKIAVDPYRQQAALKPLDVRDYGAIGDNHGVKIAIDPMAEFVRQVRR